MKIVTTSREFGSSGKGYKNMIKILFVCHGRICRT